MSSLDDKASRVASANLRCYKECLTLQQEAAADCSLHYLDVPVASQLLSSYWLPVVLKALLVPMILSSRACTFSALALALV